MTQKTDDKINVFWFLPTHGDGRYLGTATDRNGRIDTLDWHP